jgi:hypothetical protein
MTVLNPFKEQSATRGDQSERSGSILSNRHLSNFNIRVDENIGGSGMHLGEGNESNMIITPRKNENNTEMKLLNLDQLVMNKGIGASGMVS